MKLRGLVLALAMAVLLLPQSAAAITVYYLTIPNAAPGLGLLTPPYPTPFGTATVDLTSPTTATIDFTVSYPNDYTIMGNKGAVGVNVNATSFTYSNLTYGPSITNDLLTWGGTKQMDGFGDFNAVFTGPQFKNGNINLRLSNVSFDLTNTSGATWADSAQVLAATSQGKFAVMHIGVIRPTNFGLTGFAGDSGPVDLPPPPPVPIPSSALLLGSGLLALGLRWRFRKR